MDNHLNVPYTETQEGLSEKDFSTLSIAERNDPNKIPADDCCLHPAGTSMNKRPVNAVDSSRAEKEAGEIAYQGHSYSEVDSSTFSLRVGPDYARNKKKAPAGPTLYEVVGVDFVHCSQRIDDVGSKVKLPEDWTSRSTNNASVPPIFIVNAQMPRDFSTSFFSTVEDGDGWSLILYLRITEETATALLDLASAPPAVRLFAQYCSEAPEAFAAHGRAGSSSGNPWVGRLKLLLRCEQIEQFGLPSFITAYNAKPVLIRNTGFFLRGSENRYVEMDLNVHKFASVPKKGLEVLFHRFPQMEISIGLCIESRAEEEMPEALFGCFGLHHLDPSRSQPFLFSPMAAKSKESSEPPSSSAVGGDSGGSSASSFSSFWGGFK